MVNESNNEYDVIVIGGGGAGLTAALYTARADLRTVLFEKGVPGGQIAITDLVENYPGFPEGIMGGDIAMKMEEQAKKYGADIKYEGVSALSREGDQFRITTDEGSFTGKAVIVATGAQARMLNVPGEEALTGKGVSYCATCDAPFFRGKTVAVIGGGDAAVQEALFLTKFVEKLYIVHRRDVLRASKILQERALKHEKISFYWDTVVSRIEGENKVEQIVLKNVKANEEQSVSVDGVFVFVGHDPVSGLCEGLLERDEHGYIMTDERFKTSVPGIFACGEVRHSATWQLVAACGEGCGAALQAQHYIDSKKNAINSNVS